MLGETTSPSAGNPALTQEEQGIQAFSGQPQAKQVQAGQVQAEQAQAEQDRAQQRQATERQSQAEETRQAEAREQAAEKDAKRREVLAQVFGGNDAKNAATGTSVNSDKRTDRQAAAAADQQKAQQAQQQREQQREQAQQQAAGKREAQAAMKIAAEVERLETRQKEVHAHERAHAAVGGQYARAPNFEYEMGPDGKRYATGGEVSIDIAPVHGNPRATINKMQQVYAAAMAPVNPSQADLMIAAEAQQKINAAKEALTKTRQEAMPEPQELAPLLNAGNAIDEIPPFEPVTPSIGGRLDGAGVDSPGDNTAREGNAALVKDVVDNAPVRDIAERLTASLAQTLTLSGDGSDSAASDDSGSEENGATERSASEDSASDTGENLSQGLSQNSDASDTTASSDPTSAKKAVDISLFGPPRAILAYQSNYLSNDQGEQSSSAASTEAQDNDDPSAKRQGYLAAGLSLSV
ncbi:hypothetical protein KJI95_15870 [Shewanella sp. JM162201]|uniref:SprA-related family protein n=1 Tax=Shewanella jiangmenensis TaxID=2837387 RepID=A0ABS5V7M9_9GAMM|nr:putative metalloprotease CJM1_0395 family protein [Shewanella jiangmenensis]MBT1445973.1 hypothetical protein [Shewanella jiangmenensis]